MGAAVDPVDAQAYPSAGGWDRGARLGAQGQGRSARAAGQGYQVWLHAPDSMRWGSGESREMTRRALCD
ncbi:hypothetical protein BCEN4_1800014 [Burkholderia cenocepacia]|nr:hypothetical protein BCEN4_1800014 [Burkholderia cenocepacia]